MLNVSTITQKGQVTIPVGIRTILGLKPADRLIFNIEEKKIIIEPIKGDIMDLYGSVKYKGKKPLDLKKVRSYVIKKIAERVAKEGL